LVLDFNVIVPRFLVESIPILIWMITEISHLDNIVADGLDKNVHTPILIQRYDLFSMLISIITSAFITGLNQSPQGQKWIGATWLFMAISCSLILKPVVNAKPTDHNIYTFQQYIIKYKIYISFVIFLFVVMTELLAGGLLN